MKKIIYNMALIAVTFMMSTMVTSCFLFHHDDDDNLQVTPMDLSLGAAKGESGSFRITSNAMWTITGEADWLSISAHSGLGDKMLIKSCLVNCTSHIVAPQQHLKSIDSLNGLEQIVVTPISGSTISPLHKK